MNTKKIKQKLENFFQKNDFIEISDVNGQGNHFSIFVVSNEFKNMSLINRHKLIYNIFEKKLTHEIHALQIRTYTYSEWKKNNE